MTEHLHNPAGRLKKNIHYGWIIIAAGGLGIFACLGISRFALGMLLPSMEKALLLDYRQMGIISTANFCGYLLGILTCPFFSNTIGLRQLASAGLLISGSSMLAVSASRSVEAILCFYFITGFGSALTNISIMGLVGIWFAASMRGKAAGFIITGNAFAIIFSGQLIPFLNQIEGFQWSYHWLILGVLVLLIALLFFAAVKNSPDDIGIQPLGSAGQAEKRPQYFSDAASAGPGRKLTVHCGLLYFIFGCTFISYTTFIVTTMVEQYGLTQQSAGFFWTWVGIISLFSGPVSGYFSDRFSRKYTLAAVFSVQTISFVLASLGTNTFFLYISVFCFGIVAWCVPSIMAVLCSEYAGPDRAVSMFSTITLIFAVGQIIGPFATGLLAQASGNFSLGYGVAALLTVIAAISSTFLPEKSYPV